jgi:hypothetical protein
MPPFTADYFCHSDNESYNSDNDSDHSGYDSYENAHEFDSYESNTETDSHLSDFEFESESDLFPFPQELTPWNEILYEHLPFSFKKPKNSFIFVQATKKLLDREFETIVYCVKNQDNQISHFLLFLPKFNDLFIDIFGFRSRNELLVSFRGSSLIPWNEILKHDFSNDPEKINELYQQLESFYLNLNRL